MADARFDSLTIRFDKPLLGKGFSFNYGPDGKYPIEQGAQYSPDKTAITMVLKIEPDTQYQFYLLGIRFKTPDGVSMDNYLITFKTSK